MKVVIIYRKGDKRMKAVYLYYIGVCVFLCSLCFACAAFAQPSPAGELFLEYTGPKAELTGEQQRLLEEQQKLPTVAEVRTVYVDLSLLKEKSVALSLFDQERVTAEKERIEKRGARNFTWYGDTLEKPGSVILVVRDDNVTGTIRIGAGQYSVRPLGDGLHAVVKIDPCQYPVEHPPHTHGEEKPKKESSATSEPKTDSGAVYRVLVAYTAAADGHVADMIGMIQLAVDETNQSYTNSDIDPDVELARIVEVSYTESGSYDTDISRFEATSDGYMDEIHTMRTDTRADVCVLIFDDDDYCGLASEIMADASSAFCVVHYDCATGYYSFGHEIGHLQGCRHNTEEDSSTTPYAYGHGYLYTAGGWRTVMAYNNSACPGADPYCTRLQYWSNPDIDYGGVAMGTSATHDNARVIDVTASTVANWRANFSTHTLQNKTVESGGWADFVANTAINAGTSFTIESGAEASFHAGSTITLQPGFTARSGCEFRAYID